MACDYFYKGYLFNSELELDDFLLEKLPFEPLLGDLVFSMSEAQLNVSSLLSLIAKDAYKLLKKMREILNSDKVVYDEDGEMAIEDPPYIGVNKFLSGLKNESGRLLFPEFREEEYWSRRYSDWKEGNFNETEIEEFELDKNNLPKITDLTLWKLMRELMTNKWKILAKTGSAIHNILLICFKKEKGIYNLTLSDEDLRKKVETNLDSGSRKYIKGDVLNLAIEYARRLDKELTERFGEGLAYYPEFMISLDTNIMHDGNPTTLMGIIDLLIVDKKGKVHVLDYKTSIHNYNEFVLAKKNSYSYLLATYLRMLEKYGLNTYEGLLLIAPIQIQDFKKNGDEYDYSGILTPTLLTTLSTSINTERMWDNIDEFMPNPFKMSITTEKATSTVAEMMAKWDPSYSSTKKITRESVIEKLKKYNALERNENGKFVWRKYGKQESIEETDEATFVDKVLKYEESLPAKRLRLTADVKKSIKDAIVNGIENTEFPSPIITETQGSVDWLQDTVNLYCDGTWEVIDNELLESFGLIMLKTKDGIQPKQIDFIRVSTNNLYDYYRKRLDKGDPLKSRNGITGNYEADVILKSNSNSLMLEAVNGNMELIETMLIINQMSGIEGHIIGNLSVVNPIYSSSINPSNEELIYCWKELNKHDAVENDKISSGTIKFANKYDLAMGKLAHIMRAALEHDYKDGYLAIGKLRNCTTILDENVNGTVDDKLKAVTKLLKNIEAATTRPGSNIGTVEKVYTAQADLQSKEVALYNAALMAFAQLKGINFRLLLKDHDKFIENLNIFKNGVSGTYSDNPGNMDSETLNLVAKLVTEAYQNVRDEIQNEKVTIAKLVDKLKREKNFGAVEENTVGNQTSLYANMTEVTADGDFLFKNPNRLQGAEKEFLEYVLYKINKNRFNKTDEELLKMRDTNDITYYRVPLAKGGADSIASTNGLLSAARAKLRYLNPKTAFQESRKKLEGLFNSEEDTQSQLSQLLFRMTNLFDGGENPDRRLKKIKEEGVENLEHNLETLLYKHLFAYSLKNNIDGVFPMIKAAMVHITTEGALLNNKFGLDIQYLTNYIKNKIFNLSIIDPKFLDLANKLGLMRTAASAFTLAFSPVQAIYLPLQGLWTDISLYIRKPDGKDSFTLSHFKKALKMVYSDLSHFSDKPTLCSAFNELYGINDMDMNTYVDRISLAKKGIWNTWNFMFKFASRPDYYNRMTIFLSQMMGDGCLDAHHISNDGELIYDWTKDKRFSEFAKNPKGNTPIINLQRSLYYTIAQLFVVEHAKVKDKNGNLVSFELNMNNPMPLPRAYTNKLAESMKSLGDDIYGYYSHEKKSLIMSTTLGSMWLQFKTYWSGKKNQYLLSGGVRLRGKWEHYSENGLKFYYQVDNEGNILYNEAPLSESEMKQKNMELKAPVFLWKGLWLEGIMVTLSDFCKDWYNTKSLKSAWDSKWNNEDENLRLAYRNNLKQLGYDIAMWLIGGCFIGALLADWLDELKKDNKKNRDFVVGCGIAAANIAVMSVKNSFMDFNAIESIGGPVGSWTPFAFEWGSRNVKNIWNVATGDEDFWDGVVKTSSGLRLIKPALDAIKPDMFRTEQEGGTFNKK